MIYFNLVNWNLEDATRMGSGREVRRKQRKVLHTLGLVHALVQRSATREEMDEEADC